MYDLKLEDNVHIGSGPRGFRDCRGTILRMARSVPQSRMKPLSEDQ